MIRSYITIAVGSVLLAACGAENEAADTGAVATPAADSAAGAQTVALSCAPQNEVAGRRSQYDSTTVVLGDAQAKICYGRPSMRGRTIFGELIPFGQLWRTGADEPTTIHLPVATQIAGIAVQPGSYSLYTIPGEREWTVIVNRSTSQWGIESQYTPEIQAQDAGRATVPAERIDTPVETFMIHAEPSGANGADLVLEWENTRVRIPIARS